MRNVRNIMLQLQDRAQPWGKPAWATKPPLQRREQKTSALNSLLTKVTLTDCSCVQQVLLVQMKQQSPMITDNYFKFHGKATIKQFRGLAINAKNLKHSPTKKQDQNFTLSLSKGELHKTQFHICFINWYMSDPVEGTGQHKVRQLTNTQMKIKHYWKCFNKHFRLQA